MFSLKTIDGAALGSSKQSTKTNSFARASVIVDKAKKNKPNLYRVLSLESENASFDEIKKAYRSMALRYHPDVSPPSKKEESTLMFVELHRAYETLSNPVLRRKYDSELRMGELNSSSVQSDFSRETWEAQLCELTKRSEHREREKAGFGRR